MKETMLWTKILALLLLAQIGASDASTTIQPGSADPSVAHQQLFASFDGRFSAASLEITGILSSSQSISPSPSASLGTDTTSTVTPTGRTTTRPTSSLPPVSSGFVNYGRREGDRNVASGDDTATCFSVSKSFPLFSTKNHKQLCVSTNGYLTVDRSYTSTSAPLGDRSITVIAPYTDDMRSSGSNIFYRTTTVRNILLWADSNIARMPNIQKGAEQFQTKQAIVVTYDNVASYHNNKSKYRYQLVLATDFETTYAIMNYDRLDRNGNKRAGFSEPIGGGRVNSVYFTSTTSLNRALVSTSNINVRGRHVYLLSKVKCKDCSNPGVMYPYGTRNGDRTYSRTYNFDRLVRLNGNWKLFSKSRNDLWISSQGYIRLRSSNFGLPNTIYDYISPYYDPYVSGLRTIYYRESSDRNLLANITRDVKSINNNFTTTRAFLVTYILNGRKFQVVLATNYRETYAVMNYEELDFDPTADVEMNEPGCGRVLFSRRSNAANYLIKSTNTTTGVRGRHVLKLSQDCVNENVMYPYGRHVGDRSYSSIYHFTRTIYLNRNWKLFSRSSRSLYISSQGYLGPSNTNWFRPPTTSYNYLAPFYHNRNEYKTKTLYYRETSDSNLLKKIDRDIQSVGKNFNTTRAYVITFIMPSRKYQVVLATDFKNTFTVLNYQELDNDPLSDVEMHETGCGSDVFYKKSNAGKSLIQGKSTGVRGRHVFSLSENCVNRGVMFPYGENQGDRKFFRSNQYSTHRVKLNETFMLFSKPEKQIVIYGSGYISPDGAFSSYPDNYQTYLTSFFSRNSISYEAIYFRDTTDQSLLRDITRGLETNGTTSFKPTRALVVTYIALLRKFQTVLATDGSLTFAVLNYEELDTNPSQDVQLNEPGCRRKSFITRFNGAQRLIQTNTSSSVRGRHIFNLTTLGCYTAVTGVRVSDVRNYVSRGLQNTVQNVNVLLTNELGEIDVHLADLTPYYPNQPQNPMSLVLRSRKKGRRRGEYQLQYGTFVNRFRSSSIYMKHNHLFVLKDTPKTSHLQYGNLNFSTVESDTVCKIMDFDQVMSSVPTIKITPVVNGNHFSPEVFVNVWMKDVTTRGFTVCVDETVTFSGKRDVTVNYIAVTEKSDSLSESLKVYIAPNSSDIVCIKQELKNIYLSDINTFVSVETTSSSSQPVLVWTQPTRRTINPRLTIDVCLKSKQQDTMHKIHILVKGDVSPCSDHSCPDYLECRLGPGRRPFCGCISRCEAGNEICGSDYKTYRSKCHLNQQHCRIHGNTTETEVTLKHFGKCQMKPFQSGRTQLDAVAELPGVFCKYVEITSDNFLPESANSTLKVFLSTSWEQKGDFVKANQASAAWSEDVTTSGFKACVLVAGRHPASDFPSPPSVHWLAVQKEFEFGGRVVQVGSQTMDTWYTGTQCKAVTGLNSDERLYASVSHAKPRNYNNAMTVWVESGRNWRHRGRVCARELQNFDGIHKGIVIHWMKVRIWTSRPDVFMPDHVEVRFPSRTIALGRENPAECRTTLYNSKYPSLANPTVLVSGIHGTSSRSSTSSVYSQRDFAVWIEQTKGSNITVCVKSLRSSITRPDLNVNILVVADLCNGFGTYHEGSCYKKLPQGLPFNLANAQCLVQGATLPVINGKNEAIFIQERLKGSTWLNLKRSPPNTGDWGWADGTPFINGTMWYPGQPMNLADHNCAVVDNRGIQTGWKEEHCSSSRNVICEKDANLAKRSCETYCVNGGICTGNSTGLFCECGNLFYGKRCEKSVSSINECSNYTSHDESWRRIGNTVLQPNGCDAQNLTFGWHRFIGQGGSKIYNQCLNATQRCGANFPGWLSSRVPEVTGQRTYVRLSFYQSNGRCNDRSFYILARNCGNYFVYNFGRLSRYSCDFGICTF